VDRIRIAGLGAGEGVAGCRELADARAAQYVRKHGVRHVGCDWFAAGTLDLFHDAAADGCDLGVVSPPGFLLAHRSTILSSGVIIDDALESEHALAL
jgi:hypothetical protein